MLDFDPARPPVPVRDAATVVVVRERSGRLELFCVERHAASGFLGGAVVFPGGKLDAADSSPRWRRRTTGLGDRAAALAEPERALGFAVAALRESLEEAAILPVSGTALDAAGAEQLRRELEATDSCDAFFDLVERHDLRLDTRGLEPIARWITPVAERRRYDTRFYLLVLPEGQKGAHDRRETTESFWASPREVLARWERGEIFLAPPTSRTVELFSNAATVDDARAIAEAQSLAPICPVFGRDGDHTILTLPGDPLHPEPGELPADPSAPTRFVLIDGRFVGERVE